MFFPLCLVTSLTYHKSALPFMPGWVPLAIKATSDHKILFSNKVEKYNLSIYYNFSNKKSRLGSQGGKMPLFKLSILMASASPQITSKHISVKQVHVRTKLIKSEQL